MKHAKGFRWGRKSKYRAAKTALMHAWEYAYRDRRTKKREFRKLWQIQINAACKQQGISYSSFIARLKKNKSTKKQKGGELKRIRLTFNISLHDLETKAHQTEKFLNKGDKVRVEMYLKGREKAFQDFAKEKVNKFLEILQNATPIKIERDLKKEFGGLMIIISKG